MYWLTILALLCVATTSLGADNFPSRAVEILRAMTKEIQACPESLVKETLWGRKANEVEQWYYGPPKNAIWNGGPSGTPLRSPYEAYIEFSVAYFSRVPASVKEKYDRDTHLPDPFLGDWKIRYEFDVSSDGVVLTKALKKFETSQRWSDLDRNPNFCWDNIPRK